MIIPGILASQKYILPATTTPTISLRPVTNDGRINFSLTNNHSTSATLYWKRTTDSTWLSQTVNAGATIYLYYDGTSGGQVTINAYALATYFSNSATVELRGNYAVVRTTSPVVTISSMTQNSGFITVGFTIENRDLATATIYYAINQNNWSSVTLSSYATTTIYASMSTVNKNIVSCVSYAVAAGKSSSLLALAYEGYGNGWVPISYDTCLLIDREDLGEEESTSVETETHALSYVEENYGNATNSKIAINGTNDLYGFATINKSGVFVKVWEAISVEEYNGSGPVVNAGTDIPSSSWLPLASMQQVGTHGRVYSSVYGTACYKVVNKYF